MTVRDEIIRILISGDLEDLQRFHDSPGIFRTLISLTYDKSEVTCWRAIEAIGLISRSMVKSNPEAVRGLAQRLLWMMRDESGNNTGSAPEILGEIIRNSPDEFNDLPGIIGSFHEEEMLRKGVLRALWRIGEVRPDLCEAVFPISGMYIESPDPALRIYAMLMAGCFGLRELMPTLESMLGNDTPVTVYRDGALHSCSLGQIAEEAIKRLESGTPLRHSDIRSARQPADDSSLRCPFCDGAIRGAQEIKMRFGSFSGGRCSCSAVFSYDRSGHSLGEAYIDALTYACEGDADTAWTLNPEEDYEIKERGLDRKRNKLSVHVKGGLSHVSFYSAQARSIGEKKLWELVSTRNTNK